MPHEPPPAATHAHIIQTLAPARARTFKPFYSNPFIQTLFPFRSVRALCSLSYGGGGGQLLTGDESGRVILWNDGDV